MSTSRRYRTVQTVSAQLVDSVSAAVVADFVLAIHARKVNEEGCRIVMTPDVERTPVWFVESDDGLAESQIPQDRDPDGYCYVITSTVEETP